MPETIENTIVYLYNSEKILQLLWELVELNPEKAELKVIAALSDVENIKGIKHLKEELILAKEKLPVIEANVEPDKLETEIEFFKMLLQSIKSFSVFTEKMKWETDTPQIDKTLELLKEIKKLSEDIVGYSKLVLDIYNTKEKLKDDERVYSFDEFLEDIGCVDSTPKYEKMHA